jgi:hypothetical protein
MRAASYEFFDSLFFAIDSPYNESAGVILES